MLEQDNIERVKDAYATFVRADSPCYDYLYHLPYRDERYERIALISRRTGHADLG